MSSAADSHRPKQIGELLSEMSPRAASVVAHQLDEAKREEVLSGLPADVARPLRELTKYSAETAGGIMESRLATLPIDITVQQAISTIRKIPRDVLIYLYVTERNGQLAGVLTMRDLLLAAPRESIEKLVRRDVVSVPDTMDQNGVFRLMAERRFLAMPVVKKSPVDATADICEWGHWRHRTNRTSRVPR